MPIWYKRDEKEPFFVENILRFLAALVVVVIVDCPARIIIFPDNREIQHSSVLPWL